MAVREQLDSYVETILRAATVEEDRVILNHPDLPRDVYEAVDEVLRRLGGKWRGGRTRAHLFPYDPRPLVRWVLESGEMPLNNPLAYYRTPNAVIEKMLGDVEDLDWYNEPGVRVLEPSAGTGAIADAIREHLPEAQLDLVELDPLNVRMLRAKGYTVHEGDFLEYAPEDRYDLILMNPPFSVEGDKTAYMSHIRHAFDLLKEEGQLVAIAPNGIEFRRDKAHQDFRAFVRSYGEWWKNEADAFKESGAGVSTIRIWMRKVDQSWKHNPHQAFPSWYAWHTALTADNEYEFDKTKTELFKVIAEDAMPFDLFGQPMPRIDEQIRAYYEAVVDHQIREMCVAVALDDRDWQSLVDYFVEQYQEWRRFDYDEEEEYDEEERAA